jgi:hypothetical protein
MRFGDGSSEWETGKISELMLDFAAPLIELDPAGPPDVDAFRTIMMIATLCWNIPVYEARGNTKLVRDTREGLRQLPFVIQHIANAMIEDRKGRFGNIPFLVIASVSGTSLDNLKVRAEARMNPSDERLDLRGGTPSPTAGGMLAFDVLDYELAKKEACTWFVTDRAGIPPGAYVLRELYCSEPNCDCRRVLLQISWAEGAKVAATINYAFEPPAPPFDDEPQIMLDFLNEQSSSADELLAMFKEMIAVDRDYHERLIAHYTLWKSVVDDPEHPDHGKVRSDMHDDPNHRPAFPKPTFVAKNPIKVGVNDPCLCGSGKKFKKCCRS